MTQEVAPRLGVRLQEAKVGAAEELQPQQLADFAINAHLPTMHAFRFFVDAGGLPPSLVLRADEVTE